MRGSEGARRRSADGLIPRSFPQNLVVVTEKIRDNESLSVVIRTEVDMRFKRITVNPQQMDGVACIRGARIPVATVVGMVADGMTHDEILQAYPDLESEDIREALRFAAEAVRERELPLVDIG
jgi:uncharacterized protein (DUF433 family)